MPDLLRRARVLERDPHAAEDLVQDTLERALRFRDSFRPGSHLRAWVFCIQQNLFVSRKRRGSVAKRIQEHLRVDPNAWTQPFAVDEIFTWSTPVVRALEELPPRLGQAIQLVDVEEFSYRDAADKLEVPVGTIMSRLHRGRSRLREKLSDSETVRAA